MLNKIKDRFNGDQQGNKKVSLADLIVLGGNVAIEEAVNRTGRKIEIPFKAGRNDTTQELTDIHTFDFLNPIADGFRNYMADCCSIVEEQVLIEKAHQLTLNVSEMTVLIGGLRVLGADSELRAQAEFYAQSDNKDRFIDDFIKAWTKVMELDRFDLKKIKER